MKRLPILAVAVALIATAPLRAEQTPPLTLVQTIEMPDVPIGPYADHPTVDVKGHRLFAAAQAHKSVKVFDLNTGKQIYDILGIENPHSILYREDVDQIFITDGGAGLVRVFSGRTYQPVKTIPLLLDVDSTKYDPATHYWYVDNGGKNAKLDYSQISIIDTTEGKQIGNIKIESESLEAIAFEKSSTRAYVNLTDKNEVAVFDRKKLSVLAIWPITKGKKNIPIALDEAQHRLYVGCRNTEESGVIVVFDTRTGKEINAFPIDGWVDDLAWDARRHRLYASCGKGQEGVGSIYVYEQKTTGRYQLIGKPATAPMAKAGLFVPELGRYYVAAPNLGQTSAKILVYELK